jgi:hypothetical protein
MKWPELMPVVPETGQSTVYTLPGVFGQLKVAIGIPDCIY